MYSVSTGTDVVEVVDSVGGVDRVTDGEVVPDSIGEEVDDSETIGGEVDDGVTDEEEFDDGETTGDEVDDGVTDKEGYDEGETIGEEVEYEVVPDSLGEDAEEVTGGETVGAVERGGLTGLVTGLEGMTDGAL